MKGIYNISVQYFNTAPVMIYMLFKPVVMIETNILTTVMLHMMSYYIYYIHSYYYKNYKSVNDGA